MGSVMIQNYTCKNPITMIGFEAGICWGADTGDEKKSTLRMRSESPWAVKKGARRRRNMVLEPRGR